MFRPNLINDIRFNQSRAEFALRTTWIPMAARSFAAIHGTRRIAGPTAFGSITIGAQPTSIQNGLNASNVQRQINFVDTASWTVGTHALNLDLTTGGWHDSAGFCVSRAIDFQQRGPGPSADCRDGNCDRDPTSPCIPCTATTPRSRKTHGASLAPDPDVRPPL